MTCEVRYADPFGALDVHLLLPTIRLREGAIDYVGPITLRLGVGAAIVQRRHSRWRGASLFRATPRVKFRRASSSFVSQPEAAGSSRAIPPEPHDATEDRNVFVNSIRLRQFWRVDNLCGGPNRRPFTHHRAAAH